jgi:carboxyl-terminal processing protease
MCRFRYYRAAESRFPGEQIWYAAAPGQLMFLRKSLFLIGLPAASAFCASVAPSSAMRDPAAEPITTAIAVATFDSLWSIVSRTYVDTVFVASEWTAVRASLRPRASLVKDRRDLDQLLAEALGHIPDSHFYVIPARLAADEAMAAKSDGGGSTGLAVRVANAGVVAWRVDPMSSAQRAGVIPGQRISRIGGKDADSALRRVRALPVAARSRALLDMLHVLNGALNPPVGDTVRVQLEGAAGITMLRSLVAQPAKGRVSQFGNLPPIAGVVTAARVALPSRSGCAGVIGFNIWLPELSHDLEQAIDSVASCDGIIVDLRGNPGGLGPMVMGFGGYFVTSTVSLGRMRTRNISLEFVINPRGSREDGRAIPPFAGPLAILIDPMTASTSEIFAAGIQRIGRGRIFGEPSAGAALPALMERLPSGDVFIHAVADFTDPLGNRIEGAGAVPDEIVPLTVKDLEAGRDAPLEAAIKWITEEHRDI